MLIKNEFEVAEPVEKVWQFFDNIPQVAACLPGAELTEDLGDDKYKGKVAVRMGPVRLQFAGTADITERDEAAKRVVVHASGADQKGRGQASMVVTATLARAGRGTKVGVTQDLQLSGAAAPDNCRSWVTPTFVPRLARVSVAVTTMLAWPRPFSSAPLACTTTRLAASSRSVMSAVPANCSRTGPIRTATLPLYLSLPRSSVSSAPGRQAAT